jgi:DNA-binding transcriptional LysR family regulator
MDITKLSRLKLSLLTTFQVLLQERSARSAAEKLSLSQSAVSKNLSQLRTLFNDPLFHRTPHGLTPTPLAKSLEGPLCEALFQIDNLLNPVDFVANSYQGRVRLALHDAGYAFIGAPLMALCQEQAPGIQMDLWFKDTKGLHALMNAEIDLLILPQDVGQQWHDDENLIWRELYREPLSCLLRSGHPALEKPWNEETYLACSHIGVRDSQLGTAMLDRRLSRQHRARRFSAMAPDFHSATRLVQKTDAIFTCSYCWAELALSEIDVASKPLPFADHQCAYQLVWHKRTENSPLYAWLRGQIFAICDRLKVRYDLAALQVPKDTPPA